VWAFTVEWARVSVAMKARINFRALKEGEIVDYDARSIDITGVVSASEEL
jgi:hypothetical protein